jgi:lysophospholipase L1-like esterase
LSFAGNDVNRVLVVSIPDYDYTPYGQNSSRQNTSERIDWYNEVNKAVSDSLGVSYVNITPISRNGLDDPALVASDNLHPSGKQYGLWAEEIFPLAKAIVDQYGEK